MNALIFKKLDINILYKEKNTPQVRKNFKDTVAYLLQEVTTSYYTPDDIYAELIPTALLKPNGILLKILLRRDYQVQDSLETKKIPRTRIEMHLAYKNEQELTQKLVKDILAILERFGLAALYSTADKPTILVSNTRG